MPLTWTMAETTSIVGLTSSLSVACVESSWSNHSLTIRIVSDHTSAMFAWNDFHSKRKMNRWAQKCYTSLKAGIATARCLFQSEPSVPTIFSPYMLRVSYCKAPSQIWIVCNRVGATHTASTSLRKVFRSVQMIFIASASATQNAGTEFQNTMDERQVEPYLAYTFRISLGSSVWYDDKLHLTWKIGEIISHLTS